MNIVKLLCCLLDSSLWAWFQSYNQCTFRKSSVYLFVIKSYSVLATIFPLLLWFSKQRPRYLYLQSPQMFSPNGRNTDTPTEKKRWKKILRQKFYFPNKICLETVIIIAKPGCLHYYCHVVHVIVIVMMEYYIIFYFSNLLCRLRSASFCNLQSFRLKILQRQ